MGTILTAFLLPFILIIVCLCGMMDAAADHNRAAVEWCFGDGAIPAAVPEEYAGHITQMRACFAVLDGAVGKLNAELEEGSVPLRANRVKADFFALNFGAPDLTLRQGQAESFAGCYVSEAVRIRTVEVPNPEYDPPEDEEELEDYDVPKTIEVEQEYMVTVGAEKFDAQHLRNITNIMASKEELIYKALQVDLNRSQDYCRRVEQRFLRQVNEQKPQSLDRFKSIWYNGRDGSNVHYHASRYHALNLHSVFQKGTVEFRMFNSTLHAGKVKTYIQFSLAIANQALTQRNARAAPTRTTNDRYTFRTWLLRLGMIGPEFETARFHLLSHLEGNIAWRDPSQLIREQEEQTQHAPAQEPVPAPGLSL